MIRLSNEITQTIRRQPNAPDVDTVSEPNPPVSGEVSPVNGEVSPVSGDSSPVGGDAAPAESAIRLADLRGFRYFQLTNHLFARLRDDATRRDRAHNRTLFFDSYIRLLLLYFFSPVVTSLRALQQCTTLRKVREILGVPQTSLGSLSEAARVFDPKRLRYILAELAGQVEQQADPNRRRGRRDRLLAGLRAVDGSLLPALPRMLWALWQDATHRAAKMHVSYGVFEGAPLDVTITDGNGNERTELLKLVRPGGFYVMDRGYAKYDLFRELHAQGVRFVVRLQGNAVYEIARNRPLTEAARQAGAVLDADLRRLGTEKHNALLRIPLRIVEAKKAGHADPWILATNAVDLDTDLVILAYRNRWTIELFFRWMKCILGCRHLISNSQAGVTMQVYAAMIASLLIALRTGTAPTKRTFEMFCHYMNGWASEDEMVQHLSRLSSRPRPPPDCNF